MAGGDTFVWRCPTCAKAFRLKAGKKAPKQCPKCDEADAIRFFNEETTPAEVAHPAPPQPRQTFDVEEPPPRPVSPPAKPAREVVVKEFVPPPKIHGPRLPGAGLIVRVITLPLALFAMWWTWGHPPQFPLYYLTYVAAVVLAAWAGSWLWRRSLTSRLLAVTTAIAVYGATYLVIQRNAAYRMRQFLEGRTVTTSYRRNGKPYFQVIELPREPGETETRAMGWGPLSENGRYHGVCYVQVREQDGTISTKQIWRWEGDEVTEQEWKLRDEGK